jgi:Pregnancy-associated plasma protein-A/Secretion system C-terminal sorting domain
VVHILYKSGSDTRTLPTEADVKKQLDITSKDFRQTVKIEKHEADKKEKFSDHNALDTKVSFCLASKDPAGKNTSGVLTVPTTVTTWFADDKMKSATTGGSTAWDTEKYLNIWVVNFPDSISGYAQMPMGPAGTDGIVIDARYFGKKSNSDKTFPYTEGKTLTHLIGNYLNVNDLWNDMVLCGDDGVDDTPIQNASTIGNVDYRHVSTCDGNPVVMTMNFMDNTNDEMQYMFTNGQKKRMHACLVEKGIRYGLVQSGAVQCANGNQALQIPNTDPTLPALATKFSYRIYPNPAQESVNFEIATEQSGHVELTVFNAQGAIQTQQKHTINEGNQQFSMNSSQWNTGLYFVRLTINETVVTERVVINR